MNPSREINTRILIRSDKFIDGWGSESALPLLEGELGFTVQDDIGILKIGPGPHITGDPSTPSSNLWSSVENNEPNERYYKYTFYSGRGAGYTLDPAGSEVLGGVKIDSNYLSPYYSNGIIIIEDGYVSMDYSNLRGDQFSFSQTGSNNRLTINGLGTTIEGPLFTNDIVTSGSITADIISASELIAEQKTTGDYLTLRYNREDSPAGTASGLILHNLFKEHPDGPDGKIELRKDDGNIWAGPEGRLQKVPYILDTMSDPQPRSVTYHPYTNTLSAYDSTFKITFYTDHTKPMPVNFNDTDTPSSLEQDIINANYIQEYPDSQEMRFRIPTLLTDFSDLAEVGAVSVTEKALWNRAVQDVTEDLIAADPYIDREGSNATNPTLVLPPIPRPGSFLSSDCKINGITITENTVIDIGTVYTAGNEGIVINKTDSTISHKVPTISKAYGTTNLRAGDIFTAIEKITLDAYGHVVGIVSKTYIVNIETVPLFIETDISSFSITDEEIKEIVVITKPTASVTVSEVNDICDVSVAAINDSPGIHKITCLGKQNMRAGSANLVITVKEGDEEKTAIVVITGVPTNPLSIISINPSSITWDINNLSNVAVEVIFNKNIDNASITPMSLPGTYDIDSVVISNNKLYFTVRAPSSGILLGGEAIIQVAGSAGFQNATGSLSISII